jgi:TonB family protein
MRIKLALVILLLLPRLAAAQDKMADQLRKAIVEEEGNQNLDKAVQAYKNILAQYDEERKTAATALFHLADCYRKQGKSELAIAAYKRVLEDFRDQSMLAEASRSNLTKTYNVTADPVSEFHTQQQSAEANQRYRLVIEQQMQLVETQIQEMEKRVQIGVISPTGAEMTSLRKELLDLKLKLAEFDAYALRTPSASSPVGQIKRSLPVEVDGKIMETKLMKKVEPVCPEVAIRARMEGVVRLSVTINNLGEVVSVKVIGGGYPPLQPAAAEAVKQWRYSPYIDATGQAVPVITTVNLAIKCPSAP